VSTKVVETELWRGVSSFLTSIDFRHKPVLGCLSEIIRYFEIDWLKAKPIFEQSFPTRERCEPSCTWDDVIDMILWIQDLDNSIYLFFCQQVTSQNDCGITIPHCESTGNAFCLVQRSNRRVKARFLDNRGRANKVNGS
jgi:hypothetical protein